MRIVKGLLAVVLATGCFCTAAWADVNWGDTATASDTTAAASSDANANEAAAPAADSYGRTADEIAVNQGIVAYWYAHGYANCNGGFPAKLGELSSMGLPLRKWVSPHTGEAIDPDDGKLDFDGDFTYTTGCNDVTITVKTSSGDVSVPGTFSGTDGCCNGRCCDIYICGFECWKCCGQECVCEIVQWIMWRSFETYECMYGSRPCDEMVWIASGLAPIDKNWKEMAPFMEIEYIWGNCCLKKAKVHCCCNPCMDRCASKCNSCGDKCGSCNKCGTQNKCNSCNSCNKCGTSKCNSCKKPSCSSCAKPSCGGCGKCNSCVKPSCGSCGKSNCNSCAKPACGKCGTTTKCGSCGGCNKCGTSKCNSCAKPSCGSCGKSSCNSCKKPSCGSCGKSSCNSCGKKSSCGGCGKSSCGSCSKCNSCAKSTCNT